MASTADVLFGLAAPTQVTFVNKIIGLMALPRWGLCLMHVPAIVAVAFLAGAQLGDPRLPLMVAAVFLMTAGSVVMHDLVDVERDKIKWGLRPLPSGLISKREGTIYAAGLIGIGFVFAYLLHSPLFTAIALFVLFLAFLYVRYARDGIGHLTEPWIPAFIPVAVWAAVSPQTLLTPLPWLLYLFVAAAEVGLSTTAESTYENVKAFFVRPKPAIDAAIYVLAVVVMFSVGTTVFFYAGLAWPYLLVLGVLIALALSTAKYLAEERSPETLEHKAKTFKTIANVTTLCWINMLVFVLISSHA
ncbi:MAG: UbiA family prenyltransferase [Halobacteriota archaeon]